MLSPNKSDRSKMKKNTLFVFVVICFLFWLGITYFLFLQKPSTYTRLWKEHAEHNRNMEIKIDNLSHKLKEQMIQNSLILKKLNILKDKDPKQVVNISKLLDLLEDPSNDVNDVIEEGNEMINKMKPKHSDTYFHQTPDTDISKVKDINDGGSKEPGDKANRSNEIVNNNNEDIPEVPSKPVIPILLFSCNRVSVNRALDLLLSYRPNKELYPIIVTQDCGHAETKAVIEGYEDQIIYIQQPDRSEPKVPAKEKKFKGYFKIARHYGWALNYTFMELGYEQVVIVEDDLEISPDFFEYFTATLPVLKQDPSLWCVSAWNDNGKTGLINETSPDLLYRTDFFPGLGWMLTKQLWLELMVKWPKSYWDDWVREPQQRKGRSCIRPEISRTKTFGKVGVSNGLFYEKHLKFIVLNDKFVPFTVMNMNFLQQDNYDDSFVKMVYQTPVVTVTDIKSGKIGQNKAVRLVYHNRDVFKKIAKTLGIMDDFKAGVPRTAYRGIVSFMHKNIRVYLAPNINWAGYDPKWA